MTNTAATAGQSTPTRKATPMEQWANHTLRAVLSCGCRKCDDGTLRIGTIVRCSSECGMARVVREAGRVPA